MRPTACASAETRRDGNANPVEREHHVRPDLAFDEIGVEWPPMGEKRVDEFGAIERCELVDHGRGEAALGHVGGGDGACRNEDRDVRPGCHEIVDQWDD
jgi:hypothetical protein